MFSKFAVKDKDGKWHPVLVMTSTEEDGRTKIVYNKDNKNPHYTSLTERQFHIKIRKNNIKAGNSMQDGTYIEFPSDKYNINTYQRIKNEEARRAGTEGRFKVREGEEHDLGDRDGRG